MNRKRFLMVGAVALLVAVPGCTGEGVSVFWLTGSVLSGGGGTAFPPV